MKPHKPAKSAGGSSILRSIVAPHKGRVALLSLVSLISALFEAAFIVLLTSIGMGLVSGQKTVGLAFGQVLPMSTALILGALTLILRISLSLFGVGISARLTAAVTTAQRRRLSHAYLRTSWAIQQGEPAGRLQQLLTTFVSRITSSVSTLANGITAGLSLIAFLATGVAIDPLATCAVLVALALVGGILTPLRNAIRRRSQRNAKAGLAFANAVSELGALGLEMQTYGVESRFEARIDRLITTATMTQRRTQELQSAMPHIYMSLAYGAILAGVLVLSFAATFELAAVGAIMLLMLRSLAYGQQLSTASAAIAANLPFLESVEETAARYAQDTAAQGSSRPEAVVPLEATDVRFAYAKDRVALADVTFRLEPGEAIGVIGPSGAGKSTLAQLLLGLRRPTDGMIRAGGVPLHELDRAWWTDRVAFVAQEAKLFTGTVAENIRFFRAGLSDKALREAAQQANILSDIEQLPYGFDTHVGERGGQLSGGQRQRLSIARALVGGPDLLVLDEPTSALDGQSEALIRSTLAGLHGHLSVVIIAHRMSTLEICDRIMVIESGRMTALDTPSALRTGSHFYRRALEVAGIT